MNDKHKNTTSEALAFTGERFVPEIHGNIELEHLHRYLLACKVVAGKTVLDIASGEGYGSAMLARAAHKVTGVDISQEAISHAQAKYQSKNLEFHLGSCSAIPLGDASVDVVVSFETIEHHDDHEAMMREIKRVLRPGGVLVISSPDKLEYSDKPGYSNPYHVKELYRDEFKKLLDLHFKNYRIYGQRVVYGSAIFCEDGACPVESYALVDDALPAIPGVSHAVYLVAVASDAELLLLGSGVLEQPINETDLVQGWAGVVAERDGQIVSLSQAVAERDGQIVSLSNAMAKMHIHVQSLEARIEALLTSRSWRVTSPLRSAATLERLVVRELAQLRTYLAKLARPIWASLPLGSRGKTTLKTAIFMVLSPVFKDTGVYKRWRASRMMPLSSTQPARFEKQREAASRDIPKNRVLLIDRRYPEPDKDAGSVTTYSVLRLLRELGYQVTFIPDDLMEMPHALLQIESLGVECLHRPKIDSIESYLHEHGAEFGVVFLFRAHVAANYLASARAFCPEAKVILNTSDLNYLRESRWAEFEASKTRSLAAQHARLFEFDVISRCDISIVMSEYEQKILKKDLPDSRIILLPLYFIDILGSDNSFENRHGICFIGGYEHAPNADAVIFFCEKVFPLVREQLPDVEFLIMGSNPTPAVQVLDAQPGVRVLGYVKDLQAWLRQVRVSVAPLQFGAGIKGKVVSSMSMGLPCVATTIAAEGMGLKHESEILIADDPVAISREVVRLYTDVELWNSLSEKGLQYCQRLFSYEAGRRALAALMSEAGLPPPTKHMPDRPPIVPLETWPVHSLADFKKWVASRAVDRAVHLRAEERIRLLSIEPSGTEVPGFCHVCQQEALFHVDLLYPLTDADGTVRPNLRERLVHNGCGLNNRMRAAIHLFETLCAPSADSCIYLTEQVTPLYAALKPRFPNLVGSEFLRDAISFGSADTRGVRNESIEHLSFPDRKFDFILTFDVLEHVPNYRAALAECARCLKANGKLLLSVPFSLGSADNILRARVGLDGIVEHLMPPEYHGDPLNSEGILCFHHFGWQLLEDLHLSGFSDVALHFYWSDRLGYMGGDQFILLATKAGSPIPPSEQIIATI